MDTLYFSVTNYKLEFWISLGIAVASVLWLLLAYRRTLRKLVAAVPVKEQPADTEEGQPFGGQPDIASSLEEHHSAKLKEGAKPEISVIVYARNNPTALQRLLPQILTQKCCRPFEVIVVNDGSHAEISDTVNMLANNYQNIYETFVPDEAHNLSRKKLGITMGIKASRGAIMVLTCAECKVASERWLQLMTEPFAEGKDVVLGWSVVGDVKGPLCRFDMLEAGVIWINAALKGRPYRGTGFNLAYRKELFFDAKGFSRSLNFHNGDDDLFVHRIATANNAAMVLDADALVTVESPMPQKTLRDLRMNHCFTGRFLPKRSSRYFGFSTLMLWLMLAATATGVVFSLPNLLGAIVATVVLIATFIPLVLAWKSVGCALNIRLNGFLLPWLMLFRCLRNANYKLLCGRASRCNYTWLQH